MFSSNIIPTLPPVYQSYHAGGAHIGLCDGAVKFLSENADLGVVANLYNRADNNPIGEF